MKKSKLDKWLSSTADRCGIEGGQGRSGAATLFSALVVVGGILMAAVIAAIGSITATY